MEADLPRLPLLSPGYVKLFRDTVERILAGSDLERLERLVRSAGTHRNGAMLIISADAATEAERLAPQATPTDPVLVDPELLGQLTNMDGGILVDRRGYCYAHGVILDGIADGNGDPARGSRYNNAVRYAESHAPPAVILCYSADGDVSVLPVLQPRVPRGEVEEAISGMP